MELVLDRIFKGDLYTIGKLYIDGVYFCDTLEDPVRDEKIYGETAIPVGRYRVIMNMSNRFKKIMPLLLNVPKFEGIRIHSGTNKDHTNGCILTGKNTIKGRLTNSKLWTSILYTKLNESFYNGEDIYITIQ